MEIAIIAPSKTQQNTLLGSLGALCEGGRAYSSVGDLPAQSRPDLAILSVSEETTLPEGLNLIALVAPDYEMPEEQKQQFLMVFKVPVRLGVLKQAVQNWMSHRRQKDKLKPITMGDYILDPKANELHQTSTKTSHRLTEKEQDILLYLHTQNGSPISRQSLLDHVWKYAQGVETHTLETHIYRLRQKIEEDPAAPKFLMTNDQGYHLKS